MARMTDEEKEICEELVRRWGSGHIHSVSLDKENLRIHYNTSFYLFFAWDDYEPWEWHGGGTAKLNTDSKFLPGSKWSEYGFGSMGVPSGINFSDLKIQNQVLDVDEIRRRILTVLSGNEYTSPAELKLTQDQIEFLGGKGIVWDGDRWVDLDQLMEMKETVKTPI